MLLGRRSRRLGRRWTTPEGLITRVTRTLEFGYRVSRAPRDDDDDPIRLPITALTIGIVSILHQLRGEQRLARADAT